MIISGLEKGFIDEYNNSINELNDLIEKHNNKTNNFKLETGKAKKKLELHHAATYIKEFNYFTKIDSITTRKDNNEALKSELIKAQYEIQCLENSLENEGIGAIEFNEKLHRFIGRSELSLRFNSDIKGYEIIRNNSGTHDGNLSEGEKTAIAFVYFITKLTESDNKIEETIVVVDDPVSSFDSNNLFHAYSFLKIHCEKALQLFVLTHNFTYFKLVRDWFNKKNKKSDPKARFYAIETSASIPRSSTLMNAGKSLTQYNSEYHYIFKRLYAYIGSNNLDRDEAFLTANLSRKLLESFLSFKYPNHRNDMNLLFDEGIKGCTLTTPDTKERIYRFINKYSHNQVIEINEDSSENLMSEGYSVIKDIFNWIEEVDKIHYAEMKIAITD